MQREVKCIFCEKTWESKDPEDFLTVCGVCAKKATQSFEAQMRKPVLRLEGKR